MIDWTIIGFTYWVCAALVARDYFDMFVEGSGAEILTHQIPTWLTVIEAALIGLLWLPIFLIGALVDRQREWQ